MRHLVLQNGDYVDLNSPIPNEPFKGVVPRDLDVGDLCEMGNWAGSIVLTKVTAKTVDEFDRITVSTAEV